MIMMRLMMRIMMTTLMVLIRDESVENPNPKIITKTAKLDWITFPSPWYAACLFGPTVAWRTVT